MSWRSVSLNDVAVIERIGVDPTILKHRTIYVGLENIETGGRLLEVRPVSNGDLKSTKFAFGPNHILYGKLRPYLAKIALPSFEGICSTDILPILPGSDIDRNYLCHFLRQPSMVDFAALRSEGANLPRLSPKALSNFQIPLPPLDEQKRIAAILDMADALRAKRRQAIALLDSLTQSIFLEMFGDPMSNPKEWPTSQLSNVTEFFAGNSLPDGVEFKGQDGGYLQLKVSDLNRVENAGLVMIAASFSKKPGSRSGTAPAGSIVFPKRGGAIATNKKRTLGRAAILDPNLMGVAPRANYLNSTFLAAWFKFLDLASISSGSSVPQLNKQDLAPLAIGIPPLQLQEEYGMRIENVSRLIVRATKSLNVVQMLFASLQHRAFTGQL